MKTDWILVANATHARVLEQEAGHKLHVLKTFHHPDSRKRSAELGDDKAGGELSGRGFGRAAFEPRMDAQQKEHLKFAHELAEYLEREARHNSYRSLVIFASSPFLGELKSAIGEMAADLLTSTHDVDLTSVGLAELGPRIEHELEQAH